MKMNTSFHMMIIVWKNDFSRVAQLQNEMENCNNFKFCFYMFLFLKNIYFVFGNYHWSKPHWSKPNFSFGDNQSNQAVRQSIHQPIHQSIRSDRSAQSNQSIQASAINQSIKQSLNQPIRSNQWIKEFGNQRINEWVKWSRHLIKQWPNEATKQIIKKRGVNETTHQ